MERTTRITVYGAEQICASCVGAPGSKDTYEWLQAAIERKYDTAGLVYEYVDIEDPSLEGQHKTFADRIFQEELFYPIVFVNDRMAAEGIPRLKTIYKALDEAGMSYRQDDK